MSKDDETTNPGSLSRLKASSSGEHRATRPTDPAPPFEDDASRFATIVGNMLDDRLGPFANKLLELDGKVTRFERHDRRVSTLTWAALLLSFAAFGGMLFEAMMVSQLLELATELAQRIR